MLIGSAIILIDYLNACRTRFQYICSLLSCHCISQPVSFTNNDRQFWLSTGKGNTADIFDSLIGITFRPGTRAREYMRNRAPVKEHFDGLWRICIETPGQSRGAYLKFYHCSIGFTVIAPTVSNPQVDNIIPKSSSGSILKSCD